MTAAEAMLTLPTDDTPIADSAILYAAAELPPVPIWGLRADGSCSCPAGRDCPAPGKHPIGNGWQTKATLDRDSVWERFHAHRGNIGIYLALAGLVLIDADGELGLETARSWGLPETLTQQSGSGVGAHYIYKLGTGQDPRAITDRRVAPGLDVKVRGQFVAAPSVHASGARYRWTGVRPPAVLPDWLYDRIRKQPTAPMLPAAPAASGDLVNRARAYIAKIPPAVSGNRGHDQCFAAARALAGWVERGLSESDALALLAEYNATCEPPWTERELAHKWASAKQAHTKPRLEDRPRLRVVRPEDSPPLPDEPATPTGSDPDWRAKLMYAETRSGMQKLVNHVDNIVRILQLDDRWAGKIAFNSFSQEIECATDLPWDEFHRPTEALKYWTDQDGTRLASWLKRDWQRYAFDPPVTDCERAVDVVARAHAYHPVRDYLESVTWDGVDRISKWTTRYLGAEDTEYHRIVGLWWLVSAVARIFEPGCKVDTVPILEGEQGKRKSTAIAALAHPWFTDAELDITSKDAAMLIQGSWMVELAEVDSLMKSEPSEAKRFFSRPEDRFRPPYGRRTVVVPRQCVFVGSTNLREYLFDPTGARRYMPIACGVIDIDALRADRDQLWAQAVAEYRDGRKWYPETEADRALLAEQQAGRTTDDVWESQVIAWLHKTALASVTTAEVFEALDVPTKDRSRQQQMRIGSIMNRLGWPRRRQRAGDRLVWAYCKP